MRGKMRFERMKWKGERDGDKGGRENAWGQELMVVY